MWVDRIVAMLFGMRLQMEVYDQNHSQLIKMRSKVARRLMDELNALPFHERFRIKAKVRIYGYFIVWKSKLRKLFDI
jgi:hypothetical protein